MAATLRGEPLFRIPALTASGYLTSRWGVIKLRVLAWIPRVMGHPATLEGEEENNWLDTTFVSALELHLDL